MARNGRSRERDLGGDLQRTDAGRHIQIGPAANVADVHGRTSLDVHAAVQAGHPPLVLVLDVTECAVPHDDDGEMVAAGHEGIGDVVFAG